MHNSCSKAVVCASLIAACFSSTATASLILTEYDSNTPIPDVIGGYDMTSFALTNTGKVGKKTSTVETPFGDFLTFTKRNGRTLKMKRGLADDTRWWVNGEVDDYDIYTTGVNWVTILLPNNTNALSFNIGANKRAGGWIKATESDGSGIDTKYTFNVGKKNTPGFSIYASNTAGKCSTLTSITIDPIKWGVGNFSINNDPCTTTAVPEPSTHVLFGFGLLSLLLSITSLRSRRREKLEIK